MEKSKVIMVVVCVAAILFALTIGLMISMFEESKEDIIDDVLIEYEDNKYVEQKEDEIRERKYKNIGENVYYTDSLIELKGKDRESVLNTYEVISDYLNEYSRFGVKIYIDNFNYIDDEMVFITYQMIDDIILKDDIIHITVNSNNIVEETSIQNFLFKNEGIISKTGLLDVNEVINTAEEIAINNREYMIDYYDPRMITGEIYLEYKDKIGIYYRAIMNNGSYIDIDAVTGEVLKTYFFNGVYY